jgi:hypothetical protein
MMHRNNRDGSYNVRGYGGARDGAGRPATGRKKYMLFITQEEREAIRQMLKRMRNEEENH